MILPFRARTVVTLLQFGGILVAVVVLQGALALKIRVFTYFDLPLVVAVYYGFTLARPVPCLAIGSAIGLMQDSLSGALLGTNGFSKTLVSFLAAKAESQLDVRHPVTRGVALLAFTLVDALLIGFLSLLAYPGAGPDHSVVVGTWLLAAAFNSLSGLVLFGLHDRLSHAGA